MKTRVATSLKDEPRHFKDAVATNKFQIFVEEIIASVNSLKVQNIEENACIKFTDSGNEPLNAVGNFN